MDRKIPEVEVITPARPGRRRIYSPEEKRRMLDEAGAPGNSVSEVARRYGVSPSLLAGQEPRELRSGIRSGRFG